MYLCVAKRSNQTVIIKTEGGIKEEAAPMLKYIHSGKLID